MERGFVFLVYESKVKEVIIGVNVQPNYIYDLETFRSCFLFIGKYEDSDSYDVFEMSFRKNDRLPLLAHLARLQQDLALMVGYNNLRFDFPIINQFLNQPYTFDERKAYDFCKQIFTFSYGLNPLLVPYRERQIAQLDLMKINHFDNKNKRCRLKDLEVAMRMPTVVDLPYEPDGNLTESQIEELVAYGKHDVYATERFLKHCKPAIELRLDLLNRGILGGDVLNYSDVKIGVEYLIKRIGRSNCFIKGSTPKQTIRNSVSFKNIILPQTKFLNSEYQNVLEWFAGQTVHMKATERPSLETNLAGIDFKFGVGGVHASVNNKTYHSTDTHIIKDVDVSGMYVSVAIANGFAPEHLGKAFVEAYAQVKQERGMYPKGTSMNATMKLAGNGAFGNFNNEYSPLFDPQCLYTVTINGQLQLLQLVERLSMVPGLEIIQANTDGVTAYLPRSAEMWFNMQCKAWEQDTRLQLEEVNYKSMFIRDCNNYLAIDDKGKIKRKGAYWYPTTWSEYEGWWNKDFSMMAVQKAVEKSLIFGWNVADILQTMTDPFDFMLRYKTPSGGAKVYIGDRLQQKTTRYYVSTKGEPMKKIAKPKGKIGAFKRKNKISDSYYEKILNEVGDAWDERIHTFNKKTYSEVVTSVESGWKVKECNNIKDFSWSDVDYNYYIEEAEKLLVVRDV